MVTSPKKEEWSREAYLAMERESVTKHEFLRGEVFAMTGGTAAHNLVGLGFGAELRNALKGRRCQVFSSDMRISIPQTELYTYPDASIACGPKFEDGRTDNLRNPSVIVEVLSESTEAYDRGRKFELYRQLPSLTDYILASQKEVLVEHFTRQADGRWLLSELRPGGRVRIMLEGGEISIDIDEVYAGVFDLDQVDAKPEP